MCVSLGKGIHIGTPHLLNLILFPHFFSASHHSQQVDINVTLTSNFSGAISCGIAFDDFKEEIYNVTAKDGKFSIQVGRPTLVHRSINLQKSRDFMELHPILSHIPALIRPLLNLLNS